MLTELEFISGKVIKLKLHLDKIGKMVKTYIGIRHITKVNMIEQQILKKQV